jgi:SAM-dependent methyltransferase
MELKEFQQIERSATDTDYLAREYLPKDADFKGINKDFWWYIPFGHTEDLYDAFSLAKDKTEKNILPYGSSKKIRFLDVGAGTGRIVQIAKNFGFDAFGIEYEQKYVKAGRKVFGFTEQELFQKDAFDIDTDFLANVDIIYTYMPVKNKELMGKLHNQLYSRAMYNTILLEMYPVYYPACALSRSPSNLNISKYGGNFLAEVKWQ